MHPRARESRNSSKSWFEQAGQVVAERVENEAERPFRMAVDRTFTIAGHGTVVTGSVSSGEVRVGDQLEIQPGEIAVRVRGVQNHDRPAEMISRGQRGAINLAGVHHNEINRGQELAAVGLLNASRSMILDLSMLGDLKRPLLDRQRIRFHVGTAEILGFVRLLDASDESGQKVIQPGQRGVVQIFLSEPAVAVWNQPFVLRFDFSSGDDWRRSRDPSIQPADQPPERQSAGGRSATDEP